MTRTLSAIVGHAVRLGRPFGDRLEVTVRDTVLEALGRSGLDLADIDTVVTCASDTLDGMMVPVKAEFAGSYGRSLLNVPSSAGHAVAAAASLIETGQAENLLMVGWGEATRLARADFRRNQADPFYTRPLGASPAMSATLQAAGLAAEVLPDGAALDERARADRARAWGAAPDGRGDSVPAWAQTGFCDGAVALILRPRNQAPGGVVIRDHGCASRSYCPGDDRLDPALWVDEAVAACAEPDSLRAGAFAAVEVAGPTTIAEMRALAALRADRIDDPSGGVMASGGGAAAHFGPATALRQLAVACATLGGRPGMGIVADLAGPMGQHTTLIALEAQTSR